MWQSAHLWHRAVYQIGFRMYHTHWRCCTLYFDSELFFSDKFHFFVHLCTWGIPDTSHYSCSWASEGFFPGEGGTRVFFQNFSRGAKSGEIWFFTVQIKETTFFAWIVKIQGGPWLPATPPPSDANVPVHDLIWTLYITEKVRKKDCCYSIRIAKSSIVQSCAENFIARVSFSGVWCHLYSVCVVCKVIIWRHTRVFQQRLGEVCADQQ